MKARTLARELALLTLFQMEKQGKTVVEPSALEGAGLSLAEMMLASVRALSVEAESQIRLAADALASVSQTLLDYEADHPDNLNSPLDAAIKPVVIPTTRDMIEKIESCLLSAEYLFEALRIPETVALVQTPDVQAYAERLIRHVVERQPELDELIGQHSEDWRVDRLAKMDRYILRLAVAEMKYEPRVDIGVSINEAVELAKRFSSEESFRLVNGILGAVAETMEQPAG